MKNQSNPMNFVQNSMGLVNPAQCLSEIVQAWSDYMEIAEEEKTKRLKIQAWEKAALEDIRAKRDALMFYLERSFDERKRNFDSLFHIADQAIATGDNAQLALVLNSITELAKSSPFRDLANLSTVQAALADPNHTWEF